MAQQWIQGYEKDPASVPLDDLPAQWVRDGVLQQIGLEVIGTCNSRCVFCEWGNDQNVIITRLRTGEQIVRKKGKIDIDLIDKIFERVAGRAGTAMIHITGNWGVFMS